MKSRALGGALEVTVFCIYLFYSFLSLEGICCRVRHFHSPSLSRIKSCFMLLNPIQTSLLELIFYFDFLTAGTLKGICCPVGHSDPIPKSEWGYVKLCFVTLNPIWTGLLEGFLAIVQQSKDNAVKHGFLRTTNFLEHLQIINEKWGIGWCIEFWGVVVFL